MANYNERVFARITFIVAWATFKREKVMTRAIDAHLQKFLAESCNEHGILVSNIHVGSFFVYTKVQCPPKEAPSKVIQLLKGTSSRLLRSNFPRLSEPPFTESLWEKGYFIATIGEFVKNELREFLGLPLAP